MRVSDAERQRAIDELRRHCAEGRLDVDEYARRLESAMGASSLEELDRLRADLPMLRIASPSTLVGAGLVATASPSPGSRFLAVSLVVVTIIVVLAAIVLSVAVSWAWAVAILVGWLIGRAQGHVRSTRR